MVNDNQDQEKDVEYYYCVLCGGSGIVLDPVLFRELPCPNHNSSDVPEGKHR